MSDEPVEATGFKKRGKRRATARKKDASEDEEEAGVGTDVKRRKKELQAKGQQRGAVTAVRTAVRTDLSDYNKIGKAFAKEVEERHAARLDLVDPKFSEARQAASTNKLKGPKPPGAAIKTQTINDFKPNICKPYYQSGWCRYGDSCKYAHIREDYMGEADLDKQWQNRGQDDSDSDSDETSDDGLTCAICKNRYTDPVITINCRHVFCAECAFKHDQKTQKCFLCHRPTNGIFNPAKAVREQLRRVLEAAAGPDDSASNASSDFPDPDGDAAPKQRRNNFEATGWIIPADSSDWKQRGNTSWL